MAFETSATGGIRVAPTGGAGAITTSHAPGRRTSTTKTIDGTVPGEEIRTTAVFSIPERLPSIIPGVAGPETAEAVQTAEDVVPSTTTETIATGVPTGRVTICVAPAKRGEAWAMSRSSIVLETRVRRPRMADRATGRLAVDPAKTAEGAQIGRAINGAIRWKPRTREASVQGAMPGAGIAAVHRTPGGPIGTAPIDVLMGERTPPRRTPSGNPIAMLRPGVPNSTSLPTERNRYAATLPNRFGHPTGPARVAAQNRSKPSG